MALELELPVSRDAERGRRGPRLSRRRDRFWRNQVSALTTTGRAAS